jgi:hypothetical protein
VTHPQAVLLRNGQRVIAVVHQYRCKRMLPNIAPVQFVAGNLNDQPEQDAIRDAVFERRPDRSGKRDACLRPCLRLGGAPSLGWMAGGRPPGTRTASAGSGRQGQSLRLRRPASLAVRSGTLSERTGKSFAGVDASPPGRLGPEPATSFGWSPSAITETHQAFGGDASIVRRKHSSLLKQRSSRWKGDRGPISPL